MQTYNPIYLEQVLIHDAERERAARARIANTRTRPARRRTRRMWR